MAECEKEQTTCQNIIFGRQIAEEEVLGQSEN